MTIYNNNYIIKTFADKDNLFTRIYEFFKGKSKRIQFYEEYNSNFKYSKNTKVYFVVNGVKNRFYRIENLDWKRTAQQVLEKRYGILVKLQDIKFEALDESKPKRPDDYFILQKSKTPLKPSFTLLRGKIYLIQFYIKRKQNGFDEYVVNVDGSEKIFYALERDRYAEENAVTYLYVKYNIRIKEKQVVWK